jgi:hypothetical protein
VFSLLIAGVPFVSAAPGEEINWKVVGSGWSKSSNGNNGLLGTVGQLAAGPSTANGDRLNAGYWQVFGASTQFCCGLYDPDNRSGNVDYDPDNFKEISDILMLARYSLLGGAVPPCLAEANTDGDPDCFTDISDILKLARYSLLGGEAPAFCLQTCE